MGSIINSFCFLVSRGNADEVIKDFKEKQDKLAEILQNKRNINKYNKVIKKKRVE